MMATTDIDNVKNFSIQEKDPSAAQIGHLIPFFANMDLGKSDISKPFWHSTIAWLSATLCNADRIYSY